MDYSKVCRSCMKDVEDIIDIAEANLLDMFSYCTRLKINDDCKLPQVFCKYCTKTIKCSYSFIRKAQCIDNKLKSLIRNADKKAQNGGKNVSDNDEDDEDNDDYVDEVDVEVIYADSETESTGHQKPAVKRAGKEKTVTKAKANKTPVNKNLRCVKPLEDVIANEIIEIIDDDDDFDDTDIPNVSDDDKNDVGNDTRFNSNQIDEKDVEMNVSDEDDKTNVKVEELKVEFEYSCKLCMRKFMKEIWIRNHMAMYHSEIEDIEGNIIKDLKKETPKHEHISKSSKTVNMCPFCKKVFMTITSYHNHIKNKKADDTRICKICTHNKEFKTICHLVYHHNKVHEKNSVEFHKFECKICGKMFVLRDNFVRHQETHNKIKPVKCDQCDLEFKTLHDLSTHKYTHRKKILCDLCGKRCESQKHLVVHMHRHNQDKPLQCPRCLFKTAYRNSMTNHMNRHDKIRSKLCPHCPLTFYTNSDLSNHVKLHTGERPYRCPYCEKHFINSWKRKTHIVSKHMIPSEEVRPMDKMGNVKPDYK